MKLQRKKLGGFIPSRISSFSNKIFVPPLSEFKELIKGTQDREMSTTMGLLRVMTVLIRNKKISKYLVPIIPDEARTFGMEGMFRQLGIYSQEGQKYTPVDYDQVSYYREDIKGQVLQEGITEAGAMSSWIAAGTSYNNHGLQTIPVYIFYSMFGFQRVGDLAWAAGDAQARGFLIGATSGKTTLSGEGLQHQDGFSHLIASNIPNCVSYDPTFNYELAVIFRSGLERMYDNQENIFYYITTLNENYKHPEMPEGVEDGIVKGMYRFRKTKKDGIKLQLMGSGAILREIISAAEILEEEYGIAVDIWSVTSFNELRREALSVERWNNLNPEKNRRKSYFTSQIENSEGPIIAATDYVKLYPDQVRSFIPHGRAFATLGTDGYGRSDTRKKLRSFFEVDSNFIVFSSIKTLWDQQLISVEKVQQAMKNCKIDSEKLDPAKI
jgi:pyruvate dehydrogenase E1 component